MKLLVRLIAFALFVVFFGFALKNTDEVVLRFFWNSQARSPLILLLLAFLLAGAVMGVLAMTGTVLRHRRELSRIRKELEQFKAEAAAHAAARTQAPAPDTLIEQIGL
jgi:putative membrane protein